MFQLSQKQITNFQQKILTWYAVNKRDLPWREIPDSISLQERAYRILISEVMSQQTQIPRVIPKYEAWIKVLPTVQDLAQASTAEVLTLWSGLGYNRRALYLQKVAQTIVSEFYGKFPEDEIVLQSLPGIGEYTAKALLCFAFDKQTAVIDTNVRKVILTQVLFPLQRERIKVRGSVRDYSPTQKELQIIADQLLPHGKAYEWNQALMDYAGAVLKKDSAKQNFNSYRQSKFKDSDRYYRGQIIKALIEKKSVTQNELQTSFKNKINRDRLEKIIAGLVSDKLVVNEKKISLP